jgi:hypothetical protein
MTEEIKFEVLYRQRDDLGSFYGSLYSKDYQVGDTLTWLGHDGVFGYLYGEEFICTEEHYKYKDNEQPVYKKVGEYDIRGTVFPYDETLKSILKRKPHEGFKNWWKDFYNKHLKFINSESLYL